jgi:tRNA 2-thiouridine synthesizing protein A
LSLPKKLPGNAGILKKCHYRRFAVGDKIPVVKVYDLRKFACPIPIVKVSRVIKEVAVGEIIEALVADRGSLNDFPNWAENSGNEIVKIVEEEDFIHYYVKRLI